MRGRSWRTLAALTAGVGLLVACTERIDGSATAEDIAEESTAAGRESDSPSPSDPSNRPDDLPTLPSRPPDSSTTPPETSPTPSPTQTPPPVSTQPPRTTPPATTPPATTPPATTPPPSETPPRDIADNNPPFENCGSMDGYEGVPVEAVSQYASDGSFVGCEDVFSVLGEYYAQRPDFNPAYRPIQVLNASCNEAENAAYEPNANTEQVICVSGGLVFYTLRPG